MSNSLRVLLAGGGTGGHVYPALAVIAAGHDAARPPECHWAGGEAGLERGIVERASIPFSSVAAGAVRGRRLTSLAESLILNARGIRQARRVIRSFRPDVVLATGGFVCVPVVLAARLAGVPSVVYLPDLRPGWAVRFLARVATAVAVSFEEVRPFIRSRRVEVTGYPVRPDLIGRDPEADRRELDLPNDWPIVVALGGSRGAQSINHSLVDGAEALVHQACVVHASGQPNYDALRQSLERLTAETRSRYRLYPYFESELAPALAAATVVVTRAGASTLGELPAVGAPGVLVPYPHAGAHQLLNARFLAERGAAVVVEDQVARDGGLVPVVLELLADLKRLAGLAAASRQLARPRAARDLYDLLLDVAGITPGVSHPRRLA